MFVISSGADGSVTIKDPKTGKTETVSVAARADKKVALPAYTQAASFVVSAFRG
jgi:hypothetical protein